MQTQPRRVQAVAGAGSKVLVDSGLLGAAKEDLRPARQPHGQPRQPRHSAAVAAAITALAALATASAVILKYFAIN